MKLPSGDLLLENEKIYLSDASACGAFVHGLEDEYREVRNAALGNNKNNNDYNYNFII